MTLSYMGTLREVTGMLQQGEISATKGAEVGLGSLLTAYTMFSRILKQPLTFVRPFMKYSNTHY